MPENNESIYEVEVTHESNKVERVRIKALRIVSGPDWPIKKRDLIEHLSKMALHQSTTGTLADNLHFAYFLLILRKLFKPYAYFETAFRKIWIMILASAVELALRDKLELLKIKAKKKKYYSVDFQSIIDAATESKVISKHLGSNLHDLRVARNRVHIGKEKDLAWPKDEGTDIAFEARRLFGGVRRALSNV